MRIHPPEWRTLIRQTASILNRIQESRFARNAAWLIGLNLFSRGIGFFGTAFAMRSLGPVNVGISALIQAIAQQVALVFNCGFDSVAVRSIADDHANTTSVTTTAVTFRLALAVIAFLVWVIVCFLFVPLSQRWVWLVGALIMTTSAGSIVFVFTGLERLPIQSAIGGGGVLCMSIAYFTFFHPNMFLGADLIVISSIGLATMGMSWLVYHSMFNLWPVGRVNVQQLQSLFRESWRYWLLAVMIFFYSTFQFPLIAYLCGLHEAGIFRSAFALAAGVELFFNSINNLLLARLVNWKRLGLGLMWRRQATLLLVFLSIGLPIVGGLYHYAPPIYSLLFGDAFKEGALIFRILIVGRLVVFLGQIYSWGVVASKLDTQILRIMLSGAVFSVTLSLMFVPKYGIVGAAIISVLSEIVIHTSCYFVLRSRVIRELWNEKWLG